MNQLKAFFYSLKRSLFEPKYYKDVFEANFWFSFKYLLFLLFILSFIKIIVFAGFYLKARPSIQPGINKAMKYTYEFYPDNLELRIRDGQLSTNVKEPYVFDIKNNKEKTDRVLLTIDTEGLIDNYPNYNSYILATKNAIIFPSKSNNNRIGETSVFYFRDLGQDLTLNKEVYDKGVDMVKPYASKANILIDWVVLTLSPIILIFGSFFWTMGTLFVLLFLTFFIWIANLLFKKGYSFGSLYKMGMHAVTWPILLGFLLPGFYILIFLVWMLIILFSQKKQIQNKILIK